MRSIIEVVYPDPRVSLRLCGNVTPLSWAVPMPPVRTDGRRRIFEIEVPDDDVLEFKIERGGILSRERNYTLVGGEHTVVMPYFDRDAPQLLPSERVASRELGHDVTIRVMLPPSYDEHTTRRYPILFVLDGQSVFGPGWRLDTTFAELCELGAIEPPIVVAVHTDVDRIFLLSPTRTERYGGGGAPRLLEFLTETLRPWVAARFRVTRESASTGILGASMGGLFAFFAAWRRPDVFGRAACLSSSFWWDDRALVREVCSGGCPVPRPLFYIDSGAARDPLDADPSRRDGHHHTAAMCRALTAHCYEPGKNLHALSFAGHAHEDGAWGARLAMPLQLLYPISRGATAHP
jgi:predicted alpha/beta superfamily hydrolase